ncbi:MAG: hypothetical protein ACOC6P_04315 [Candidatus Aminicenantaceae bacterium]
MFWNLNLSLLFKKEIKPFLHKAAKNFNLGAQHVIMITETFYKAKSWPKERRVIAREEYNLLGSKTLFSIANLKHRKPPLHL